VFTAKRHWSPSSARKIQSAPSDTIQDLY